MAWHDSNSMSNTNGERFVRLQNILLGLQERHLGQHAMSAGNLSSFVLRFYGAFDVQRRERLLVFVFVKSKVGMNGYLMDARSNNKTISR